MAIETIKWVKQSVRIIDQTQLPHRLEYINCRDVNTLCRAIRRLSVRGAPALGVAAGFGVLLGIRTFQGKDRKKFLRHFKQVCDTIGSSRPTAVNLFNVLDIMRNVVNDHPQAPVKELKELLHAAAFSVYEEDKKVNRRMGRHGATLIKNGDCIMTICNAGALATVDYGTALGVMFSAKAQGKHFGVYALESRPLLQGARLTAWELLREKIDVTLICDSMAAAVMKDKNIKAIFTGADRIAANGDSANKIGTQNLAILAAYHKIPFYIVAPRSTFDLSIRSGRDIPIEERDKKEVLFFAGRQTAPSRVKVYNPAFDVTDHKLISGIVTEAGIIRPPFVSNIKKIFKKMKPAGCGTRPHDLPDSGQVT